MLKDLATTTGLSSSPTVTSGTYTFAYSDVGAYLFIYGGGTNTKWTPGWYKITGVSGMAATLSAGVGAVVFFMPGVGPGGLNTVPGCAAGPMPDSPNATWSIDYSQQPRNHWPRHVRFHGQRPGQRVGRDLLDAHARHRQFVGEDQHRELHDGGHRRCRGAQAGVF
jgi:hypothetical protein